MALRFRLTSIRPGYGELSIQKLQADGDLELSFQRSSDQHYLAAGEQWTATAHWHRVTDMQSSGDACTCTLGPDIIDGLLRSSNDALMVVVQGSASGQGVLQIVGRLLGSDAAGNTAPSAPATTIHTPAPDVDSAGVAADADVPEEQAPPSPPPPTPSPAPPSAGFPRWLRILLPVLLLLAALFAAWYFKLIPGIGGGADTAASARTTPETAGSTTASGLKGRALAQSYLGQETRPSAVEMYSQAGEWEQADDCTAAMIVYQYAAQADPAVAVEYARRFDPDSFSDGGCIRAADADTASYWYERPAEQGDVAAQRQLGKLLVRGNSSGILYERGLNWLKRAAKAGDDEATALLGELGGNE